MRRRLSREDFKHAWMVFAGLQLCKELDLYPEEVWDFVKAHWGELYECMAEAVVVFHSTIHEE